MRFVGVPAVVGDDAAVGHLEGLAQLVGDPGQGGGEIVGGQRDRGDLHLVEAGRQRDQRGVTIPAHLGDDRSHRLADVGVDRSGSRQHLLEPVSLTADVETSEGHNFSMLPGGL